MKWLPVLAILVLAAPAQAQEYSATASPDPVRWPQDEKITWRVKIKTAEETSLALWLNISSASPESFGVPGFSIAGLLGREVVLEGPGRLTMGSSTHGDPCWAFIRPLPMYGLPHLHGTMGNSQQVMLDLPANSESTLVVPAAVSRTAPWAGAYHELKVTPSMGPGAAVISRVGVEGRTGLPIAFNTEPGSVSPVCAKESPEYESGTNMVIRGHTDPRAAGDFMTIMAGAPGETEAREIGKALIAPDGTFGFSGWRPAEAGFHAVAVHYRSQRPELADDFAPPLALRIRAAEGKPEPPPPGFPELVGKPRTQTKTALRLRCIAPTKCSGRVRLRRAGRSLVGRGFSIQPGSETVVRLPLPAREGRALRRRGRLAVDLQFEIAGGRKLTHRVTLLRR